MYDRPGQPIFTASFDSDTDIHCTACSYNLRGIAGQVCPECGTPFKLAEVGRVESYAWYLVALICTAGLVNASVYILYLVVEWVSDPLILSYYEPFQIIRYLISLPAAPYLVLLLVFRKRIVRAALGARLMWAIPPMVLAGIEVLFTLYEVFLYY